MVRHMAPPPRNIQPGYTVIYPNRDKAASKSAKGIVVLLLLASVALMLLVTFGGWSKLQGLKAVNFIWSAVYLIIAFYVSRWARGLLPIAAALAVLLLILSVIAGTGYAGTSWFDRNHTGFGHADSIFGGTGFGPDLLGLLVVLIAPVQVLLIGFGMYAFGQGWNVEQEVPIEEARRRTGAPPASPPAPAAA
jgi:hypothetical protein